ncbi:TPA: hypothetical protein ACQ53F_000247 [Legionella pneumophila]
MFGFEIALNGLIDSGITQAYKNKLGRSKILPLVGLMARISFWLKKW